MGFALGHCLSTDWIIPWHHGKTTRNLHHCPCDKSHDNAWKWQNQPCIPLCDAFGEEVVNVATNINLLVCVEI